MCGGTAPTYNFAYDIYDVISGLTYSLSTDPFVILSGSTELNVKIPAGDTRGSFYILIVGEMNGGTNSYKA